jgi:hypothetical protein
MKSFLSDTTYHHWSSIWGRSSIPIKVGPLEPPKIIGRKCVKQSLYYCLNHFPL